MITMRIEISYDTGWLAKTFKFDDVKVLDVKVLKDMLIEAEKHLEEDIYERVH